jgi:cytochrome b
MPPSPRSPTDTDTGIEPPPAATRAVLAWDAPTRLFHWTLVALIVAAVVSVQFAEQLGDSLLKWHRRIGIAILVLLVWRVAWGFLGSSTARFTAFVGGPRHVLDYFGKLLRGVSVRYLGHNPLGAYMVLALLLAVGGHASLGLFTVEHNDITAGPLYRLLSEDAVKQVSRLHRLAFYWLLLPLIGAHVAANVLYGVVKREPLIPAMITGRKPAAEYVDAAEAVPVRRPLVRALVLLAVSAAVVLGTIKALGGRLP